MNSIVFLIQCEDRKGLVCGITSFFYERGFNIVHCQQHSDSQKNRYFMRIKLDMGGMKTTRQALEDEFAKFAKNLALSWSVHYSDMVPKLGLMVTKESHCLYDLILRWKENEFSCEIPLIVGNRPDLEYVALQFKIPFYCFPVEKDNEQDQEKKVLELFKRHHIDLVVLARYMRILTPLFVNSYRNRIINIHHAFLPAFHGGNPYRQAYERGVKMIGATAHYVTEDLDEGPIIEQNVEKVNHESEPDDLKQIGKDIERTVLAKAVKAHIENRIIVTGNRTVVFS